MIPRTEIDAVETGSSIDHLKHRFIETGFSRILVYENSIDNITGYAELKDLFKNPSDIKSIQRKLSIVPETMPANRLLKHFVDERKNIALVVDEFGGTSGMITIEDVLEEIVGEIDDEHDAEDKPEVQITAGADGAFTVQALTPVEDFNEHFNVDFDTESVDTVGGLVTQAFGHMPERGEAIEIGGFLFEVAKADARRVQLLRVRPSAA